MSGGKSIIETIRHVKANTPTLGDLIDFEENKDNNKWMYSTRDEYQDSVQIGNYAMWLVPVVNKQLWNTEVMLNTDILNFWEGSGTPPTPEEYESIHLADPVIYQPPIAITN